MATRGQRRKALRVAYASKSTTSAAKSMPPRLLREAYSIRQAGDPTIASYCADPLSDVDPRMGFST